MHHRCDAHGILDGAGAEAGLDQDPFVAVDAHAAAVDGRYRKAEQFEIGLVDAGAADDGHAQSGRQFAVFIAARQVDEAVLDVIHAHDGRGGLGRLEVVGVQHLARLRLDHADKRLVAAGDGRGQCGAPDLRRVQMLVLVGVEHVAEIDLEILGIVGQMLLEIVDVHFELLGIRVRIFPGGLLDADPGDKKTGAGKTVRRLFGCIWIQQIDGCESWCRSAKSAGRFCRCQAACRCSSPGCQLHGHNSSDCSASRMRSVSFGLRPTFMSVTEACRMMPSGSTRNVARLATPSSACRMPSAPDSSRLTSASIGIFRSLRSSWCWRHAMCTNSVSVLAARTWQSRSANSSERSLKALISVGQTKVKSFG